MIQHFFSMPFSILNFFFHRCSNITIHIYNIYSIT